MVRHLCIWLLIIIVGFTFFAIPQIPFQIGFLGGYQGINLTIIGLLQTILVVPLLYFGLRCLKLNFSLIGFTSRKWKHDVLLGGVVAVGWALIQFMWLIPSTGGEDRVDISQILEMVDGSWVNVLWYLPLGIIGGALSEELYNRGFFIGASEAVFGKSRVAICIVSLLAIVFFAAGHLPSNTVEWVDLLIPSAFYTALYLYTKRLTAPIIAHGLWNTLAVIMVLVLYG